MFVSRRDDLASHLFHSEANILLNEVSDIDAYVSVRTYLRMLLIVSTSRGSLNRLLKALSTRNIRESESTGTIFCSMAFRSLMLSLH
jgi:hypothetical protein